MLTPLLRTTALRPDFECWVIKINFVDFGVIVCYCGLLGPNFNSDRDWLQIRRIKIPLVHFMYVSLDNWREIQIYFRTSS